MGEVYRARDTKLDEVVALKLLPEGAADPMRLRLLLGEVRVARQISHPNVCRVHDVVEAAGLHFMTMELIEGEDLGKLLSRSGPLPAERAVVIGRQVCDGLTAAHERGILHRDLKPGNLMVDTAGTVRLADFGLAGLIGSATTGGRPRTWRRSCGTTPTRRSRATSTPWASSSTSCSRGGERSPGLRRPSWPASIGRSRPTPPSTLREGLAPAVERAILRCLDKDPRRRPRSARAVAAALAGLEIESGKDDASDLVLRPWPPPELPAHPYPVLLPYQHPDLLAGRERDVARLGRLLRSPVPIHGLSAPSGTGKSSLLLAGLVPRLRAGGRAVALDRHPAEPGLAGRLVGDLLEVAAEGGIPVADADAEGFVALLVECETLAGGVPPILVLDQFEDVLMRSDAGRARATLGVLLAATCRHRPGRTAPPCRWLLAYREEYHGEVVTWLADATADARREGFPGLDALPHDLSGPERFAATPLPPLGTPAAGSRDPLRDSSAVFRAAIEAPLGPHARRAASLPVALRRRSRGPAGTGLRRGTADAPRRPARARAAGRPRPPPGRNPQSRTSSRSRRTLSSSSTAPSTTTFAAPWKRLSRPGAARREIGPGPFWPCASWPVTRRRERKDGPPRRSRARWAPQVERSSSGWLLRTRAFSCAWRDRLAQAGRFPTTGWPWRLRGSWTRKAAAAASSSTPSFSPCAASSPSRRRSTCGAKPRQPIFRVAATARSAPAPKRSSGTTTAGPGGALAGSGAGPISRRRAAWSGVAAFLIVAAGLGIASFVKVQAERAALLEQVAKGNPEAALAALDRGLGASGVERSELLSRLRLRPRPFDVLESGMGGVPAERRARVVLDAAELAMPLLAEAPKDNVRLASLLWALDYAAGGTPGTPEAGRAVQLRDSGLASIRRLHPPPPEGEAGWVLIPRGTFWMGAAPNENRTGADSADEHPRHQVTVSAFRVLDHEVTCAEYRRLVPEHEGDDELPAARVTWYDAYVYAAWLGGRLPTEAEWEYAARAGCENAYCTEGGREARLDEVAWWTGNSSVSGGEPSLHPARERKPNQRGLFDVYGNVSEWTADWYGPYPEAAVVNPRGPAAGTEGTYRTCRGGSAFQPAMWVHPSGRTATPADGRSVEYGLRPVHAVATD